MYLFRGWESGGLGGLGGEAYEEGWVRFGWEGTVDGRYKEVGGTLLC